VASGISTDEGRARALPFVMIRGMPPTPPWYVLTGGPCAGKTTTIDELSRRGHPVLAESARLIIEEKLARGKTIEEIVGDPEWLVSVVRRAAEMHREVPHHTFFFDRGIPDSVAYYRKSDVPLDDELVHAMREFRYRKIFLLDLVDFENDEARSETPEEAQLLHGSIRDAYAELGYEIVEVPVMTVEDRADFVLANL